MANDKISGTGPGTPSEIAARTIVAGKVSAAKTVTKAAKKPPLKAPPKPAATTPAPGQTAAVDETLGPQLDMTRFWAEGDAGGMDADAVLELIQALRTKVHDAQVALAREGIESRRKKLEAQHQKTIDQLKKSDEKAAQAKTGNTVAEALTWVAFALAMILAIVTAVVSFGAGSAVIGAVAIIGAAIAVTVTILNETGVMDKLTTAMGDSIASTLEACGVSKEDAKRVGKIIAQVIVAVVIIAVEIALAAFSGGSSLGEAVGEITSVVAQRAAKIAVKCIQIGNAVAATVNIASASSSVAAGVLQGESLQLTAEAMRDKGIVKKLEALIERDQKLIRQLVKLIEDSRQATNDALEEGHRTREKIVTSQPSMA